MTEPQWLTDALADLDALEGPADVNPQVFSDLKSQLAQLLHDKAAGKIASSISADFTQALNLRFKQDSPEADVYLEWGYVNRGDYDQDGTVDIADVTPVAQQLTNSWFEGAWNPGLAKTDEYKSIVAVVDGNLNGQVYYRPPNPPDPGDPGDLLPIAVNFLNSVANYSIYGSDDPEDESPEYIDTIAFTEHEYVGPPGTPPKRLFYRFNVSELPSQHRFAYYWVQPYDNTVPPNYGAFSDSYWTGWGPPSDATPDPANLRPVISGVSPANYVTWPRETDITFKYSLSDDGPQPPVAQEWDFNGAAAGQTQIFTDAEPAITLTSDIGLYSCTLVAENAFGESEEFPFYVDVKSGPSFPVVSGVVQDGFTASQSATFTCELSAGPGDSFEWYFAGGAEPNSTTSYTDSVTVTLASVQQAYPGAWVEATNLEGTSDRFYFTVAVGNPPTGVSAGIPETLVLNEEATFTASYDPSTMPPVTFTWNFGAAGGGEEVDYVTLTPEVSLVMQDGGTQYGSLKVSNARGEMTVGFDFYVHWNELRMRVEPLANGEPDYLFGDDGYVTVIVYAYDIGHPLRTLTSVYLEYDKRQLAPPLAADLESSEEEFWGEWNLGAMDNPPWYRDGWWTNYGPLWESSRVMFFYRLEKIEGVWVWVPTESKFPERSEDYCSISVNLTYLGQYYADAGSYGDLYNFRMYLPEIGGPQPPAYEAEIKNYRAAPLEPLITYYEDQNEEVHVFSNEPSIWISVHGD